MKTWTAPLALLISASLLLAQVNDRALEKPTKSQGAKQPDPEPTKHEWQEFTATKGRFKVMFPGKPQQGENPAGKTGIVLTSFTANPGKDAAGYRVTFVDLPAAQARPDDVFHGAANRYKEIKSRKPVRLGPHPGIEFMVELEQNGVTLEATERNFLVGQRLYILGAWAEKGKKDAAGFARFFGSFQVIGADAPHVWQEIVAPKDRFTACFPGKPERWVDKGEKKTTVGHKVFLNEGKTKYQIVCHIGLDVGDTEAYFKRVAAGIEGKVTEKKVIDLSGLPALRFVREIGNLRTSHLIVPSKDGLYEAFVIESEAPFDPMRCQQFLDSFRLLPEPGTTDRTALPADLDLVPRDGLGFVSIQMEAIYQSALMKRTLKELEAQGMIAKELGPNALNVYWDMLGAPFLPEESGRLTVFVNESGHFDNSPLAQVWSAREPYDRKTVLGRTAPNAKEKIYQGKSYFLGAAGDGSTPAVWFVNERVLVRGEEKTIRHMMGRKKIAQGDGPLEPALLLAAGKQQLVTVGANGAHVVAAEVLKTLKKDLGKEDLKGLTALSEIKLATLTVDLDNQLRLDLALTFAKEEQALAATRLLKTGLTLGREMLAGYLRKPPVDPDDYFYMLRVARHVEASLVDARIQQDGLTVRAALPIKLESLAEDWMGEMISLTLESARNVRGAAVRTQAANNLKILALAMHSYHDTYGHLPAPAISSKAGKPLLSWRVAILPYIEHDILYKEFHLDEPWDSPHNIKLIPRMPSVFGSNSHELDKSGMTFYQVFVGPGAAFEEQRSFKFTDFADGISNTLLIVEAANAVPWTKPADLEYAAKKPLPKLGRLRQAAFADGSVRFLPRGIDAGDFRALITRNGGEVIKGDYWPR